MKTLRFLMVALLATLTVSLQAQLSEMGTTSFGLRAGVNFQNINGDDATGDNLEYDLVPRWHAGVNVEFPIAPDFFVQPGLMFVTKGAKATDDFAENKISLGYIELPVNLIYKPLLGTGHVVLGIGPYVGYGITGKVKADSNGQEEEYDVEFQSTVEAGDPEGVFYMKPLDVGANMQAGYEFAGGLSFHIITQLGLVDIYPDYEGATDDDTKFMNTGFGLSLGYRFY